MPRGAYVVRKVLSPGLEDNNTQSLVDVIMQRACPMTSMQACTLLQNKAKALWFLQQKMLVSHRLGLYKSLSPSLSLYPANAFRRFLLSAAPGLPHIPPVIGSVGPMLLPCKMLVL